MTVGDDASPPQARDETLLTHLDIENLVYLLEEKVRAADDRAKIADERSQELTGRLNVLENTLVTSSQDLLLSYGHCNRGDNIQTVVGVPETENNDVDFDVADRITLLEKRLDEYDDINPWVNDDEYRLPESTFSLLVTERPLSAPFMFALFSAIVSISLLGLVLTNAATAGTARNRLNVPPGVCGQVRAAQFFGLLVGVLFEDECPQGLQHIAFGMGHSLLLDGKKVVRKRLIVVSILRLVVGYLFLSCLFINVLQNNEVISIFYDVLALEFVENIDDTAFTIATKGFFGKKLLVATMKRHTLEIEYGGKRSIVRSRELFGSYETSDVNRRILQSGSLVSKSRANNFARLIYFFNGVVLLAGLTYISVMQSHGMFRCRRFHVSFSEAIWKDATVVLSDGTEETRLLVYPYFNGIYAEVGSVDNHPRYVEQDKFSGKPFIDKNKGAEIRYCDEIRSWIFKHPQIQSSNECGWLFRSHETTPQNDYDLASAGPWLGWVGDVVWDSKVSIKCTSCLENGDCSYQGTCDDGVCSCFDGHTGHFCESEKPCDLLATEKAEKIGSPGSPKERWVHENPISLLDGYVYDRPVFIQRGLGGADPFDWRKFDVRQREPTSMPSFQPSAPSASPAYYVKPGELQYSVAPTPFLTPTVGTNDTLSPSHTPAPSPEDPYAATYTKETPPPTVSWYEQNEYEVDVEDFAEHDDFFEAKPLHDLEKIMQNYSVVLSFSGSRFYGTIVEPDSAFTDIFPTDYHAFWENSFQLNRTFIISDETDAGSPVGIDFYEMRRRIPSNLNENVHFAYSPYGALVPNMNYKGSGFFHCLDGSLQPSTSPSP